MLVLGERLVGLGQDAQRELRILADFAAELVRRDSVVDKLLDGLQLTLVLYYELEEVPLAERLLLMEKEIEIVNHSGGNSNRLTCVVSLIA